MDPINKLTRLLEALRLQQSNRSTTESKTAHTNQNKQNSANNAYTTTNPEPATPEQLYRRINTRINQLTSAEIQTDRAKLLFIESVLAWKFGDELLQSDLSSRLANNILTAFNENSELNKELQLLMKSFPGKAD